MNQYLLREIQCHPLLQPGDVIKFCYQAAFGAEHILADRERAGKYLQEEYNAVSPKKGTLQESISDEYCRIDLAAWKAMDLDIEKLFDIFVDSVKVGEKASDDRFRSLMSEYREVLAVIWDAGRIKAFDDHLSAYYASGIEAVHHSEAYRKAYDPHYRVVRRDMLDDFLQAVSEKT